MMTELNTSKNLLSTVVTLLLLIVLANTAHSQETDLWSGDYSLMSSKSVPLDTLRIEKNRDANKDDVAYRFESDLRRWIVTSKNDAYKDKISARPFLYDLQNDENEYEQFGWTDLFLNGEMNCIDAGHFFICQTTPNTEVKLDDEESFHSKTGFFGIRLHFGLFELELLPKN